MYHLIWNLVQLFGDNNTLVLAHSCVMFVMVSYIFVFSFTREQSDIVVKTVEFFGLSRVFFKEHFLLLKQQALKAWHMKLPQ